MARQSKTPPDNESRIDTSLGWLAIVLGLSLPLYRPWLTLAANVILVLWLFGGGRFDRFRRLRGHGLTRAVLAFLALNVVSLLWTNDLEAGLRYLTKYRYFLLIPAVASSVGPVFRRTAVTAFELATGASVVVSFVVMAGLFRIADAHPGNPSPTMAHLDYGLLLAVAALMIVIRVLYSNMTLRRRLLWFGLAVFVIAGLFLNIGRAGQLAFVGGLLVMFVHWGHRRPPWQIAGTAAGLILVVVLVWTSSPIFQSRLHQAGRDLRAAVVEKQYDTNLGGRLAAMAVAREMFHENPILGTGVGGNIPAFRQLLDSRFQDLQPSVSWYRHFHNQYAQIATELGLAGLIVLAWIFWELIRRPYRNRETDAAALVLATVFLLGFLGEPFFHKQITLVMFAMFAGFISAERLEEGKTPNLDEQVKS